MSRFIETIHLKNGKFLNLLYHQERIDRTFREFFPGITPLQLHGILKDTCNPSAGRYKYTLRYSDSFEGMHIIKYEPKKISRLFLKNVSILNYSYKNADPNSNANSFSGRIRQQVPSLSHILLSITALPRNRQ